MLFLNVQVCIDFLKVNEDATKLRRSADKPIPENNEERRSQVNSRSVYAVSFSSCCGCKYIILHLINGIGGHF